MIQRSLTRTGMMGTINSAAHDAATCFKKTKNRMIPHSNPREDEREWVWDRRGIYTGSTLGAISRGYKAQYHES